MADLFTRPKKKPAVIDVGDVPVKVTAPQEEQGYPETDSLTKELETRDRFGNKLPKGGPASDRLDALGAERLKKQAGEALFANLGSRKNKS